MYDCEIDMQYMCIGVRMPEATLKISQVRPVHTKYGN